MKAEIVYNPNVAQTEYQDDLTTKYLHLSGGFGSGKTFGLIQKLFLLSWMNRPFPGGLVCPTFTDYRRDVLPAIEDILFESRIKYHHHKSEHSFTFPWSRGKLYVVTADKRIRGPNWGYAGINEVTLIPAVRYREVIARVRLKGPPHPQIASSGTPEGLGSDYYEIFVDKPLPNSKVIYASTRDNEMNLGGDYVQSLESSYDSAILQAYRDGLWVNMTGNRFYYSYDPKRNDNRTIERDYDQHIECFMDFNVDPMVATFWHFSGHKLYGFDEISVSGGDTTKRMIQAMKNKGYDPPIVTIYPDPSGNRRATQGMPDTEILRQAGYRDIRARSVAPGFRQRQLNVNNLLDKWQIEFNPDKMPMLKKDLLGVEQDTVTYEKVKKNPRLTHASDGLDYGCDILFPFSGNRAKIQVARIR